MILASYRQYVEEAVLLLTDALLHHSSYVASSHRAVDISLAPDSSLDHLEARLQSTPQVVR